MKSEHRHELKTNELGRIVAQSTPFFEKYSNYILIGLGAIIAVAAVAIVLSNRTSSTTAGWGALLGAQLSNSTEQFAEVADNYPNTSPGDWASLIEAESYLENGIRNSFTDRESSNSDLKKANDIFEKLTKNTGAPEDIRKRALFGLARCSESSADGNTAPAIELYKQLMREYPDQVYNDLAEGRIKALETSEAKDFYAWFHKQDPKPEDRSQPRDQMPFGLPPDHPPLRSGATLPEVPPGLMMPAVNPPQTAPALPENATSPKAEDKKPAGEAAPAFPEKTSGDKPTEPTPPTEKKEPPAEPAAPSPK